MSEELGNVGRRNAKTDANIVRVALASLIGTTIEWYDFYLYGTAAALAFNTLFFPTFSSTAGMLAAFATFWVGFGARPIGGMVFGHFGDRIGRKSMLVVTLLLMGVATFLIGVLPTYAVVGVWAPVLLVLLRFVQGFAVGGEWGGSVLLVTEYAPGARRGFFGSWPQSGVSLGLLLSTGIFSVVTTSFSSQQFLAFGWRIPFLVSFVLVLIGLFIRLSIAETPEFRHVKETHHEVTLPVVEVLRRNSKHVVLGAGIFLIDVVGFYLFTTYVLSYGTALLGIARNVILNATLVGSVLFFLLIPVAAAISDRVGRKPVYIAGILYTAAMAFPLFWLFDTKSAVLIVLAICLAVVGLAMMHGPQAALFSELFGAQVRYSGISLGYQIGSMLGGGLTPLIATALVAVAHSSWPASVYLIAIAVVSLISISFLKETRPARVE
jgi:MFS transporter, MHS family, shikimate and dehydroshikimate transport protein